MSTPLWVSEVAAAFWADVGRPEPFPRNLRRPIADTLPLTLVLLPKLRVVGVDAWLQRNSIPCGINVPDRPLRACLVARYGHGFVFVDGIDPEGEQRFSLAHELAHFLGDYWQPRRRACERLGPAALEVFDGERPPHPDERIRALLARVPLGSYIHFMERTADGHLAAALDAVERDADRLAFELLAPADTVLADVQRFPSEQRRDAATRTLREVYGLPAVPAEQYATLLVPPPHRTSPLLRRLRLVS